MDNEFNKYVKKAIEKYEKQYNYERNKFIFTDIIDIYLGVYKSYDNYVSIINSVNECIASINEAINYNPTTFVIEYHPLHVLLSEEDFKCIKELRTRRYEKTN